MTKFNREGEEEKEEKMQRKMYENRNGKKKGKKTERERERERVCVSWFLGITGNNFPGEILSLYCF
jgi:hypothetical protein